MADHQSIEYCRADFPALGEMVHGKPLAYLDTASSAQKPLAVIEKMRDVMAHHYANVHRGLYTYSQTTTHEYESVRRKIADFINAKSCDEIIFTRNTTEGINLTAYSWGGVFLKAGDEIILTQMEHHSNIVPWQLLQDQIGFIIRVVPVLSDGSLDIDTFKDLLSERTKLVGVIHVSNALGAINPVEKIIQEVRSYNSSIRVLVDASQSIVHCGIDVQALDCDFMVFTGHKLYGPTGSGVLWVRENILESMRPYQGGGDMIESVSFEKTYYKTGPARFEAGTPAFVDVIGLGAAIDYIRTIGQENIKAHEKMVFDYAMRELENIEGLAFYGRTREKVGIVSFTADWAKESDVTMVLDQCGVAVRTGHHCCMPLMKAMGLDGTIRASIGLYTNQNDIDSLVQGLKKARSLLS